MSKAINSTSTNNIKKILHFPSGYSVTNNSVYFLRGKIAEIYRRNELYTKLLNFNHRNDSRVISYGITPKMAIFVPKEKTIFVIENRLQKTAYYVYRKLQACDFKNKQYKKLFGPLGIIVKYVYILNDWFEKDEYRDVLAYVKSVGCYYFFNELPLDFLGLSYPT